MDGCFWHPLHMFDGRSSIKFWEIPHDSPRSRKATIFEISGAFVEFSWRFRGVFVGFSWLRIIAPKAFSHSWPVFVGFSWDFRGPTKNEISGIIGEFFVAFSWASVPRQQQKTCASPLPRKALKRLFLGAKCLPHNQVLMQEDSDH